MAVTHIPPHIKAQILVDDIALQEHEDDEEQTSVSAVTAYIEVRSGAEFAIRYRLDEKPEHDISVDFLLDGKYVAAQYAMLKDFRGGGLENISYGSISNEGGVALVSKYAFSDLKTGMCIEPFLRKTTESLGSRCRWRKPWRSANQGLERHGADHDSLPLCRQPEAGR
jgi:hypothetical protein